MTGHVKLFESFAPMLHHMACDRVIAVPLDVALPQMMVNLVLIPGICRWAKHSFSADQFVTVV